MGLLDLPNMDNVPEIKVLDADTEVILLVKKSELTDVKDDPSLKNLFLTLEVEGDPLVDDIRAYIRVPAEATREADLKKFAKEVERFKTVCKCFNVDIGGDTDADDFVGRTGEAILNFEDDPTYGRKNSIKTWIVGA